MTTKLFPPNDSEGTITRIVTHLMSIPESNERYQPVLQALTGHYQNLRDSNVGNQNALRSVFTLACISPDVMGVGL